MSQELNWSDPVITQSHNQEFPIDTAPHYLADLCKAIALEVQVPIELPYFAAMSVLAAATNGKIEVVVKGRYKEHLSFYNIIGLGSGNRKSEVIKTVRRPLADIERNLIEQAKPEQLRQLSERETYEQSLEGLQAKARSKGVTPALMADIQAEREKLEKCKVLPLPKIFADNITPEKHAEVIAEHGSSAIIEPEGGFFEGLSRYGTSKTPQVDYLNKTYGGEPFRVDRKVGNSIFAEQPHCVLHFSIQPHLVRAIRSNADFMGTGFANRFLFSLPQSLIGSRSLDTPPVHNGLLEGWKMTIESLFKSCHNQPMRQLTIDPAGYQLLRDFQEALEPQLITNLLPIQGWASKLPGALVRIAALYELAANEHAASISAENMEAAIALAPYLQDHALQALTAAGQDQPINKLLAYLVEKQEALEPQLAGSVGFVGAIPYQFTTRQLQQQFNRSSWLAHSDNKAATLRGLLVQLSKDLWLQLMPTQSTAQGGRPAELWAVNPKAPESFRQLYA